MRLVDDEYYWMVDEVLRGSPAYIEPEKDRTGTGYYEVFGYSAKYTDVGTDFPVLALKETNWRAAFTEMFWFLSGSTHIEFLHRHGVHIWDEWSSNGWIGPMYGHQWRHWEEWGGRDTNEHYGIDQMQNALNTLRANPTSRRNVVTAWNVADLPIMALAPCHGTMQWNWDPDMNELNLMMFQRSADLFLGLPFNVANYALLQHMFAKMLGMKVGTFTHAIGSLHIYDNHVEQCEEVLGRADFYPPATVGNVTLEMDDDLFKDLPKGSEIDALVERFTGVDDHFKLHNYNPLPAIKGKVAV